jgi:hypothetical protein
MQLLAKNIKELTGFNTFGDIDLIRIESGMVENGRAIKSFGRNNSQVTIKLMSLTMTSAGPYRRLRQCVAEIDKRSAALHESAFTLRKKKAEIHWKENHLADMPDSLERDLLEIELDELRHQIKETQRHAEGALKDIAGLQEAYTQIRDSHGIPENWDEADFHNGELREHVLAAFQLAFRDMMERGSLGRSTQEYLEQFGIHPFTAQVCISDYLMDLNKLATEKQQLPEVIHLYQFLDACAERFGENYKHAMQRIGLTTLVTEWAQYREHLKT